MIIICVYVSIQSLLHLGALKSNQDCYIQLRKWSFWFWEFIWILLTKNIGDIEITLWPVSLWLEITATLVWLLLNLLQYLSSSKKMQRGFAGNSEKASFRKIWEEIIPFDIKIKIRMWNWCEWPRPEDTLIVTVESSLELFSLSSALPSWAKALIIS